MEQIIKIRCNGPNKHINEIDLNSILREDSVARHFLSSLSSVPERTVLRCRHCTDGRVIVTREIIADARRQDRVE